MKIFFIYEKKTEALKEVDLAGALEATGNLQNIVWINLFEPSRKEIEVLGQHLNIHELTLEDIQNPKGRPKVEEFEDYLFCIFKALNFNPGEDQLDMININLVLKRNLLLSAHLKPLLSVKDFAEELQRNGSLIRKGPASIMYRLLDNIVDRYFPLLDELDEKTDDIQARIFENFDPDVSADIFMWKTKIAHLRRRVGPQREILMNLANRPHQLLPSKVQIYYRDVYDHIIRTHDNLESYRDILQGAMDSYMTQASNRMNEIMKVLSIVATIMLPLGFLTGLYGTNFEILPGSKAAHAFWIFVSIMVLLVIFFVIYFKKKKWF